MSKVKTQADLDWEVQCYGMTADAIEKMLARNILGDDGILVAASLLSDAQEALSPEFNTDGWVSPEYANRARQLMNVAKYIMFKTRRGEA